MIADILVLVFIGLLVGLAAAYIVRQKKKGAKCIGCPAGADACRRAGCTGGCSGCTGSCAGKQEPGRR